MTDNSMLFLSGVSDRHSAVNLLVKIIKKTPQEIPGRIK